MAGERTIRLRFTGDSKGLVVSTKAAETALDRFQDKVNKGFGNALKGAAAFASKMSDAWTATNLLAGAVGGVAVASGALLALPAIGAGIAATMITAKLGADGVKKAFEGLSPTMDKLKGGVSKVFQDGLEPVVNRLKSVLPQVSGGLKGIAGGLVAMAQHATATLAMPKNMASLNGVLAQTGGFLRNMAPAAGHLVQILLDLVSVGTGGMGSMGTKIAEATKHFAEFVRNAKESGKLKEVMQAGFAAIKQFGQMLGSVLAIVGAVFTGISQGAGGLSSTMGPAIETIRKFVTSVPGQEMLRQVGAAMASVGASVSGILWPALQAILPLIGPLAGLFANLTATVVGLAVPIINFLAPGLQALAGFIQQNIGWLGPLTAAIGGVIGAQKLWNMALNANPIMLIVGLIGTLVTAFLSLWQRSAAFRDFFIGMWNGIRDVVVGVIEGIKSAFKAVVNAIISVINGVIWAANKIIDGLNLMPFVNIPHIPSVPKLARGGVVTEGGMAMVGERGRELVNLPAGAQVHSNRDTEQMLGGGTPEVRVFIGDTELRDLVRVELVDTARQTRRRINAGPGGQR